MKYIFYWIQIMGLKINNFRCYNINTHLIILSWVFKYKNELQVIRKNDNIIVVWLKYEVNLNI